MLIPLLEQPQLVEQALPQLLDQSPGCTLCICGLSPETSSSDDLSFRVPAKPFSCPDGNRAATPRSSARLAILHCALPVPKQRYAVKYYFSYLVCFSCALRLRR